MAVEEKEDHKGRRKREVKNVSEGHDRTTEVWMHPIDMHPFMTVDELSLYRKKRPHLGLIKDNLKIEEGSFRQLKSEYTRRFKNFYEALKSSLNGNRDLLGIEEIRQEVPLNSGRTQENRSEYDESFNRHIIQRLNAPSDRIMNEVSDNEGSNRLHQFEKLPDSAIFGSPRRHFYRRPTNLKIEGDFYHLTEHADKFIEYLLAKRAELCRTPTTLKLGTGEMESKTETSDQFKKYDNMERPSLSRKFTNLHLEDGLENKTEQKEKFLPFDVQPRPPLIKRSTNLHLEGDYSLVPEYRHQYVQYHNPERSGLILPSHNLKSARLFEDALNEKPSFGRKSPLIPFLRESYSQSDLEQEKKFRRSNSSSRYQSNLSINRTSSHPNLVKSATSADRMMTPRTPKKNAYLDFDRGQNMSLDRRFRRGSDVSKSDVKFIGQAEYKSAFTDFPRERPRVRRPESNFSTKGEVDYLTEKHDKYREYKPTKKSKPHRMKSDPIFDDPFEKPVEEPLNLVFEGPFECQPEYRKAYIDYLVREKPPLGQRRRILEIPDINIDTTATDIDTSSPNGNTENTKPTSKEDRPRTSLEKPNSASSSVPSSPKTIQSSGTKKIVSKEDMPSLRKSPDQRQRVFHRSLTPSPVPPEKPKTPKLMSGNWRRHEFKEGPHSETDKSNIWNSFEADPAFFVLNDRVQSRRSVRNDLYKEQRWMPSWYSGGQ